MLSKTTSLIFSFLFLIFIIGITAYLETTLVQEESTASFVTNYPAVHEEQTTSGEHVEEEEEDLIGSILPTLENKLVDTKVVGGYIVEEYQEYEIYKDQEGKILKSVATSNFSYIRYMQN
ncbi:hypothetical protein [Litchfieldia salsa]|uniref:Uncharacterized protein n=1 Tax=Litchfieldia salsa TaxID=930152 RepID=A0A1H0WPK9_9BACI|nr:hypothetical protein [Litchfieldia salsa]SDP92603.1 hypothetical protein SAMN05216565_11337 [Litchfieldia salsa]